MLEPDFGQTEILNYIERLSEQFGLDVSFHFSRECFMDGKETDLLEKYRNHRNPYCVYVKNGLSKIKRCFLCQDEVLKLCENKRSFLYTCHSGVCQYVMRVMLDGRVTAFVSANGFKSEGWQNRGSAYDMYLKEMPFSTEFLDSVLTPLAVMLSVFLKNHLMKIGNNARDRVLNFVNENYTLSLSEISSGLGYSKSYISHIFKKSTGYTLKSYCNIKKIEDAKGLLKNTDMDITDIAFTVGFLNVSYFIQIFKTAEGMTPFVWRKNNKEK